MPRDLPCKLEFHPRTLYKSRLLKMHARRSYIHNTYSFMLKKKNLILEEESHGRPQDTAWMSMCMAGRRLEPRADQDTPGSRLASAGEAWKATSSLVHAIAGLPAALP